MGDSGKGIGNYIHFHANNYREYGIGEKEPGVSYTQALKNAKKNIKSLYPSRSQPNKGWKKYASCLNDLFYYNVNKGTKYNTKISQEDYKYFNEIMNALFYENAKIMLENAGEFLDGSRKDNKSFVSSIKAKGRNINKKRKNGDYQENIKTETLKKIMENLENAAQKILASTKIGIINEEEMANRINMLADIYKKILNEQNKAMQADKKRLVIRTNKEDKDSFSELGKIINIANNLIKDVNYRTNAAQALYGPAGEYGLLAMAAVLQKTAGKSFEDLIKGISKQAVGTNKQPTTIDGISSHLMTTNADTLLNEINNGNNDGPWRYDKDEVLIYDKYGGSQGTVDVIIKVDSESDLAKKVGLSSFNASMKNYSSAAGGVKGISGAPLLSILNLLETDFVNHYLNLLSVHEHQKDEKHPLKDSKKAIEAKNLVMYAAAVRAISGSRGKSYNGKMSDVLVVNDKAKQHVYVVPTTSILNGLSTMKQYEGYLDAEGFPSSFENRWVKVGNKEELKWTRIAKLLGEVHRAKISLTITQKAIQTYSSKPVVFK